MSHKFSSLPVAELSNQVPSQSSNTTSNQPSIKQILDLFNSLPEQDRAKFINQILSFNSSQTSSTSKHLLKGTDNLNIDSLRFPEEVYCLHCWCSNMVKRGLSAQGKQRIGKTSKLFPPLCEKCANKRWSKGRIQSANRASSPTGGFLQSGGGYPGVPCGSFCSSRENAEAPAGKCREAMDKCGRFSPCCHVWWRENT